MRLTEQPAILKTLFKEYWPKKTANKGHANNGHKWKRTQRMDDDKIFELLRKDKNAEFFFGLHDRGVGNGTDESSLDMQYVSKLSFYTQDAEQIKRLHASSQLYRDKTDSPRKGSTYIDETIDKALENITETYAGPRKKKIPPVVHDEATGRATINIHQHHRELCACIHAELIKSGDAFQRNGELARIAYCVDKHGRSYRIQTANKAVLHDMIVQTMDFQNSSGIPASLPDNVIRLVGTSAWREDDPPYPPIKKIITCPSFRSDKEVIVESGYDEQSHIFAVFPDDLIQSMPEIPKNPTQQDGIDAAKWLCNLFGEFPFVDNASRTHLIALLLTLVCKEIIPGLTPLFIIDANNQSAGKTLLCLCLYLIATGKDKPYTMHQGNESQMRADLLTALRAGFPFLVYGNLDPDKIFRSKVLSDTLTSRAIFDRKYLSNDEYLYADNEATIAANGNGVQVDTDIMDRAIFIQLCADSEHPEDRDPKSFQVYKKHGMHLKDYVVAHWGEILVKVLTIPLSYLAAENKPKGQHWGKYPEWAEVIGSMVEFVGLHGFRENTKTLRKTKNVEKSDIARFLVGILEEQILIEDDGKLYGEAFTVSDFAKTRLANDNDASDAQKQLTDLLPAKVATAKNRNQALGILFNRIAGTPYHGYTVRQVGMDEHIHKPEYRIEANKNDYSEADIKQANNNAQVMKQIAHRKQTAVESAEAKL